MAKLTEDKALAERRKYARAFFHTMKDIWKEQVVLLGVMDTRRLLKSPLNVSYKEAADAKELEYTWTFLEYGIWQNYGTGREVYRGNPGDIGREKKRKARKWFSKKYFASLMNMSEFMAENIGREFLGIISDAMDYDKLRYGSNFYKTHPM